MKRLTGPQNRDQLALQRAQNGLSLMPGGPVMDGFTGEQRLGQQTGMALSADNVRRLSQRGQRPGCQACLTLRPQTMTDNHGRVTLHPPPWQPPSAPAR